MTQVAQSKEELWLYLQENLDFLRRSAQAFDNGAWAEAKRLAVIVRLLLHDNEKSRSQSRSLLSQLKLLPGMGFLCTARPDDPGLIFGQNSRLVLIKVGADGVRFEAPADRIPPRPGHRHKIVLFPHWWNEPVVRTDASRFCRRDIVLTLRDKVGGAHVDPSLDQAFSELMRDNPLGITAAMNGEPEFKVKDIELHTMRQIAHEVLKSIERELSKD